tara:strand:- start:550 stop:888 length:339 start_codon:yes stop_codon:yes gene_type:complete
MTWTESDHARLVALKVQRAEMRRVPDEQIDKEKIKKLTIEIKSIKKRLIAHEKGVSVAQNAPVEEVEAPVEEVEAPVEEVEKLTWPQFRSKHKGKPKEEISTLWAEYKESLN